MNNEINNRIIQITDSEFEQMRDIIYREFGINLTPNKRSLVVSRMQRVLKEYQLPSFTAYLNHLKSCKDSTALSELVNRISTNHTFFFREYEHFTLLMERILPEIVEYHSKKGSKDIRIWCAAASSGEEPYTIALHLREYFGANYGNWNAGLLATDISEDALRKAIAGRYSSDAVSQIPQTLRTKYFKESGGEWVASELLRKDILYKRFNLMTHSFPFRGGFDLIFCRNVMIYFDQKTKQELVKKLHSQLRPGGYLFIGHSETLNGISDEFKYIRSAVYQRET